MLDKKRCKDCYFYEQCHQSEACEDFTPMTDEASDEAVYELIENGREEFRSEWNQYITENHD